MDHKYHIINELQGIYNTWSNFLLEDLIDEIGNLTIINDPKSIYDSWSNFLLEDLIEEVVWGLRNEIYYFKRTHRLTFWPFSLFWWLSLLSSEQQVKDNTTSTMEGKTDSPDQWAEGRALLIYKVPDFVMVEELQGICDRVSRVEDVRITEQDSPGDSGNYNLMIVFLTQKDARLALDSVFSGKLVLYGKQFEVTLAPPVVTTIEYIEESTRSIVERGTDQTTLRVVASLLRKPICQWCKCEQEWGDFSTPCLSPDCTDVKCHECLKRSFEVALKDRNTMPLQCHYRPFHPDVLQGLVPQSDLEKYKARYQEMCTKSPLYCPVLSCSTFIPSHKVVIVDEKFTCPTCDEKICIRCHRAATESHVCSGTETEKEDLEISKTLRSFGYKRCPGCGAPNAKMFGCDHMKCLCFTDYCWKCEKILDECICGVLAENAANENATAEQINSAAETGHEHAEENLDAESYRQWETESLDFGHEPDETYSTPVWQCSHLMLTFDRQKMPRFWMTARNAEFWKSDAEQDWQVDIECMVCWKPTKITNLSQSERLKQVRRRRDGESPDSESFSLACICLSCGIVCCSDCADKLEPNGL